MRIYPAFDLVGAPVVLAVCAVASIAESLLPLRRRTEPRGRRWSSNAWRGALAGLFVRAAVVPATQACARAVAKRGGLVALLPVPPVVRAALGFLALDYTMYLWHRALHRLPALWRFHAVHHADRDLDATTALRFHLGELVASVPYRCAQVLVVGARPSLAIAYELAIQTAALFHHSNLRLPPSVDAAVAHVFVTPRMHGVHHSVVTDELQSNWSVVFSFWDRLHGTFEARAVPPSVGLAPANDPRARRGSLAAKRPVVDPRGLP